MENKITKLQSPLFNNGEWTDKALADVYIDNNPETVNAFDIDLSMLKDYIIQATANGATILRVIKGYQTKDQAGNVSDPTLVAELLKNVAGTWVPIYYTKPGDSTPYVLEHIDPTLPRVTTAMLMLPHMLNINANIV